MTDTTEQLSAILADLLAMSRRHSMDTPIACHCENLRRMFLIYPSAYGDEAKRAKLELSILRQWADLVGLTGGV